ncbi:YrdB family protein [Agreia sp. COWG]|uniref:YrdB family protein n=1 Tax=Agreia sp. COWG TaxID=2773266 RepID=UPI0019268488|nr:YrdB family protein [Agreia sp. COWG]CAD6003964.1 Cytochrome c-type biogenesis protein DsbD, protein-disulfide reductase [Agreia sp. COWG]
MQTRTEPENTIGINDVVRFVLELFAFVTLGIWGFLAWPGPWLNIVLGIAAPVFAILVWALFRSPKAVVRLDAFGKALIEILIMGSAALAWLMLGQPVIAVVFGVVAAVSGVLAGRRELS